MTKKPIKEALEGLELEIKHLFHKGDHETWSQYKHTYKTALNHLQTVREWVDEIQEDK